MPSKKNEQKRQNRQRFDKGKKDPTAPKKAKGEGSYQPFYLCLSTGPNIKFFPIPSLSVSKMVIPKTQQCHNHALCCPWGSLVSVKYTAVPGYCGRFSISLTRSLKFLCKTKELKLKCPQRQAGQVTRKLAVGETSQQPSPHPHTRCAGWQQG